MGTLRKTMAPRPSPLDYQNSISDTYTPFEKVVPNFGGLLAQSSDGKYVYVNKNSLLYRSSDYGKTFSEVAANPFTLICSDDGKYVYWFDENFGDAGELVRSPDYGETFSLTGLVTGSNIPAISAVGQYVLVADSVPSFWYYSDDYGVSFVDHQGEVGALGSLIVPVMSKSGQYQFVVNGGELYYSSDYGQTWTLQADNFSPTAMKCSDSGQYLIATDGTNLWISNDYGVSWSKPQYNGSDISYESGISAISSSGEIMIIGRDNNVGYSLFSNDFGINWFEVLDQHSYSNAIIASDETECRLIDGDVNGAIYIFDFNTLTDISPFTIVNGFANSTLQYIYASDGTDLYRAYLKNVLTITPSEDVHEVLIVQNGVAVPIARPYKVYTALLNQNSTDAPIATVLENTIGDIVWTRSDVGTYFATCAGAFITHKTCAIPGSIIFINGGDVQIYLIIQRSTDNEISLGSYLSSDLSPAELAISDYLIEIRVYY